MSMEPLFDLEQMAREAAAEAALAGLPGWWAGLPDGPAHRTEPTGKCLYASPTRGLAGRVADLKLWCEIYGSFGSYVRSHAWRPSSVHFHGTDPEAVAAYQLDRHEPVPLDCDLRRDTRWVAGRRVLEPVPPCGHHAGADAETAGWRPLAYRGACRKTGCDWEGPERSDEKAAVEDGMDHAWPGWRTLPPVPRVPDNAWNASHSKAAAKSLAGWLAKVTAAVYPDGWVEGGGPVRTVREGTHVEARTPFGGWDLALTCHLCGAAENLMWLTGGGVTVAACKDGCPAGAVP